MKDVIEIAKNAKTASVQMMSLTTSAKNDALENIAKNLSNKISEIMAANALDLKEAQKLLDRGEINKPTYDRLKLDDKQNSRHDKRCIRC
jgi:glutamate-5-semialdehyde dehydrogenase